MLDYVTTKTNSTMHLNHRLGKFLKVNWADNTATTIDTNMGETIPAHIFVDTPPYSRYANVKVFFSMDQKCQFIIEQRIKWQFVDEMVSKIHLTMKLITAFNLKNGKAAG